MLPVRCFTCNNLIGHMWEPYIKLRKTRSGKDSLDDLQLRDMCCRRMLLTHVPVIDDMIIHPNADLVLDECNTTFSSYVKHARTLDAV